MKNSVVFTYGRFNPPHLGHKKMIQSIVDVARTEKKKPVVIVSHSAGNAKNPLNVADKLAILRAWFPKVTFMHSSRNAPVAALADTFANDSIMIVGEDRRDSFGFLNFKKSSVARNNSAPSATQARAAATRGNAATFKRLTGYDTPNILQKIQSVQSKPKSAAPKRKRVK